MLTLAVLAGPWPRIGVVAGAALAATTMLARTDRWRAWSMLGALVLAPVLLLDDIWQSSQLEFVHRDHAEAAVGIVLVLVALGAAAYAIHRIPWLLAPLTAFTVPFRIPIPTVRLHQLSAGAAVLRDRGRGAGLDRPDTEGGPR